MEILIKYGADSISSEEFNKFNVLFVTDAKNSKRAIVKSNGTSGDCSIILDNGANYNYIANEKAIYRDSEKIAKNIVIFNATLVNNDDTNNKNVVKVKIGTGKDSSQPNFGKTINYVLRYW